MNKEQKTVNIETKIYDEMAKEAEQNKESLKSHIETVLELHVKKKEKIAKIWSGLKIEQVDSDNVVLANLHERKFYDIGLKDNLLYCEQDRTKGCEHTAYLWSKFEELPELRV